jgi:hypothetical protein
VPFRQHFRHPRRDQRGLLLALGAHRVGLVGLDVVGGGRFGRVVGGDEPRAAVGPEHQRRLLEPVRAVRREVIDVLRRADDDGLELRLPHVRQQPLLSPARVIRLKHPQDVTGAASLVTRRPGGRRRVPTAGGK